MRVDLYTKAVLTVIAACLLWICLNDTALTRTASAQAGQSAPQRVIIAGISIPGVSDPLPIVSREPVVVAPGRQPLVVTTGAEPLVVETGREPLVVAVKDAPLKAVPK